MVAEALHLEDAVRRFVRPGMHLHFPSTPSRSNAAIREIARVFRGQRPAFHLSTSGFHSMAHLLPMLRLGRLYSACFFGDNFPAPRANRLYQALYDEQPTQLRFWSLLSYCQALRAGGEGQDCAPTTSLADTDLGSALAEQGDYFPNTTASGEAAMVRAMVPDIAFLHAPVADRFGNVAFSAPHGEGFFSALGAKVGVVISVEKIQETRLDANGTHIPREQILGVCREPRGSHPQPLYVDPDLTRTAGVEGYADDFEHYKLWRKMATDEKLFALFERMVLTAKDGRRGYRRFAEAVKSGSFAPASDKDGSSRVESANEPHHRPVAPEQQDGDVTLLLAARTICERVRARGHEIIIAGIGKSFAASRLAKLLLEDEGIQVSVIVETGLIDIACGAGGHPFLLSYHNIKNAGRRSDALDALGVLACGRDNRCLGVLGAGEVDATGALNSLLLRDGRLLVGSGGANDIASNAAEVVVLSSAHNNRMVHRVFHRTSPGHRVSRIVTERFTLARELGNPDAPWAVDSVCDEDAPLEEVARRITEELCWSGVQHDTARRPTPMSASEQRHMAVVRASETRAA